MFIGHYAGAPLAASTGKIKLWHGFLAVQFVDILWAGFVLTGVEKVRIVPADVHPHGFDSYFMPYTHSLVFTLGWALIAALAFKAFTRPKDWGGAMLIGLLVISHWVGDVIVHGPDMTLYPGSSKFGFGVWNHPWISVLLELGITLGALAVYVAKTKPVSTRSQTWTFAFFALLIALELFNTFGGGPKSVTGLAFSALAAFIMLIFAASRYERTRSFT